MGRYTLTRTQFHQGNIILALIELEKPATAAQISKKSDIGRQLVSYHLPRMIKIGLILIEKQGRRTLYKPQPFLQSNLVFEAFYQIFTPLMEDWDPFEFDQAEIKGDEVFRNNFMMFLSILRIDLNHLNQSPE